MSVSGINSKSYYLNWQKIRLKLGDKIRVSITEIEEITPLVSSEPTDRQEMKQRYYDLKKQLEEKNLI